MEPASVTCTQMFQHDGPHRFVHGTEVYVINRNWLASKREDARMARESWEREQTAKSSS